MAKIIQQLDFFGMPMENPSPSKKTKQPVKSTNTASKEIPRQDAAPAQISSVEPIVYSNEQIVVKVKSVSPAKETIKSETKRGRKSFKEINAT